MYRHQRRSPGVLQVWMAAHAVVIAALAVWILKPGAVGGDAPADEARRAGATSAATPAARPVPIREQLLALPDRRFGLSAPQVPWSVDEVDHLAGLAGARPTLLQYFVKWNAEFRPEAVRLSHRQGALPVISWEPWDGLAAGEHQPRYALRKIARGAFDDYLVRFATGVRDQRYPVAIRFAHEMNGHWYPWSERRSGNRKGDYVRAWRHVHDVFAEVGATNVIWIWSPNILRPVPNVDIEALYPGDDYVDWVGMVGYAVREKTAGRVFEPTLRALERFTRKPVLITETGVHPGRHKAGWIRDFFRWLPRQRNVVGFVWFEFSEEQGGTSDWRFSARPENVRAFAEGLARIRLTAPLATD